jgi:2-keto-4-pentenoate hydratase
MSDHHGELAESLAKAWIDGTLVPLPAAPLGSREAAYVVQDRMAAAIGGRVAGWKVGAPAKAVQMFEGHDGPIPGRVFEDRLFETSGTVSSALFHGAKVECEYALRLTAPLPETADAITRADLEDRVVFHPAIELAATRYAPGTGGRAMNTHDGIADNGTGGAAVLGDAVTDWRSLDFAEMEIVATIDGSPPIQTYSAVYRLHPLDVLADIVNDLAVRGIAFEVGQFLMTGSQSLPTPFRAGQTLTVRHAGLPALTLSMT